MTDREKAIVMAYTDVCMLEGEKLDVFYRYLAELYGRPVYTHEMLTLETDIKEKSKPDFLELCREVEPECKTGRSIGKCIGYTDKPCPNCGRLRVERYEKGIEICEKCNWCIQTKSYWLD